MEYGNTIICRWCPFGNHGVFHFYFNLMGGKHEQSLTLPLWKRHDLGREQINVNISLEKIGASGFITYPELSCGNDYKILQATKKCFKLGHSGTRGIPGHQPYAPLQHQAPRHWEIPTSRWMRYNPDLRHPVDQGHGFVLRGPRGLRMREKNGNKNRQVIQVMLVERTKPMVQMAFIWCPMEWNWFENSDAYSNPKNDATIMSSPNLTCFRAAVTGRPWQWIPTPTPINQKNPCGYIPVQLFLGWKTPL